MFNILVTVILLYLSRLTTKPTKWHVRPAKTQINLGIRPVWSESSLSTWGLLSLERTAKPLIRLWADAQADLNTSHLLCTTNGRKGHFVVLAWVASFYFVLLASTILISIISRRFISWNSPRKRGFLCIHARVCLSPFIMSHCRRVVILTFIFHDGRRVSLFI